MKRLIAIYVILIKTFFAMAQEPVVKSMPNDNINPSVDHHVMQDFLTVEEKSSNSQHTHRPYGSFELSTHNSLNLLPAYRGIYGDAYPRFTALHDGLNVSFGTSVFASFGKNVFHGVGFTQDISLLYAVPLSAKTYLMVGGFADFTQYANTSFHRVGMSVAVHHDFNENWSATVFGHKSLLDDGRPFGLYDEFRHPKTSLGATVRYRPNDKFSFEVTMQVHELDGWQNPFDRPVRGLDW